MSKETPELRFLAAADLDRLAALVFELSAQLHIERHQRMALEAALIAKGTLAPGDIARLAEDQGFLTEARAAADQSLRKLMRILAEDDDRKAPLRPEIPA
jgi:hypothetical protein